MEPPPQLPLGFPYHRLHATGRLGMRRNRPLGRLASFLLLAVNAKTALDDLEAAWTASPLHDSAEALAGAA